MAGWQEDEFGTLTLSVTIRAETIRLATVLYDAETGLYETFIGRRLSATSSGGSTRAGSGPSARPRTS